MRCFGFLAAQASEDKDKRWLLVIPELVHSIDLG